MKENNFKKIPGVDTLLNHSEILKLIENYGSDLIIYSIRNVLDQIRRRILIDENVFIEIDTIIHDVSKLVEKIGVLSLKRVINATGIILHTNLGRAPLGEDILKSIEPVLTGYSNLEFNLDKGSRGNRIDHLNELIKYVAGAEDAVVVNNNAAGVFLSLKVLAEDKEVIVSRGELIEIGGSFRLPEIINTSGCKMIEVGTTNRTRISDYENAITNDTKILFKVHKSNYYIGGFTEEVGLSELSKLAKKFNLYLIYDIGSGLLFKPPSLQLEGEPDVKNSLRAGADLITFSCDKLLGGPQAGVIAGKKELISAIAKSPLMRALRIDKLNIALLSSVLNEYLVPEEITHRLPAYKMINKSKQQLLETAQYIKKELIENGIKTEIAESKAYYGGGTLPNLYIDSYSLQLIPFNNDKNFAEKFYKDLLALDIPIVGILKEGKIYLNVLTLFEEEAAVLIESLKKIILNKK
jgi:L-seryl-tRNA(Ser) seleniumtransferase